MICCQYHIIRLNELGKCGVLVEKDFKKSSFGAESTTAERKLNPLQVQYMIYDICLYVSSM